MKQRFIVFLTGLLCSIALASAQTTVTGSVVDANGDPVVGAAVFVEGFQTVGTMSDLNGNFTLKNVPDKARYIVASCMGYKDLRLPVKATMRFVLEDDSTVLDAAVATGMQTVDRRLMTGSTSKVDAESAKLAGIADISRSLEGRVAGVSVQNVSGTFGTAPKIRVRGATSIYGSSKPLWVVDGVIMEDIVDIDAEDLSSGDANTLISSAIAGLNSDDIESFDILKDGSATSIYGARAMAGVIVVTTKKGKAGQSHISYTGEYTVRLKPMYSTFNIMNSQDQMSIYQELQQKGYLNYAETANSMNSGIYGKMYQLISQYDATSGKFGLQNTDEARAAYLRAAEYRNTDWFDLLFSNSLQHNHSVSTSGGTEKSNYYASLSVMDDPGWTLQSSVQRFTANINSTYRMFDNVTLNVIGNASYRTQRAPGTLGSSLDAVSGEVKRDFDINPYSYALNTSRALDADEYYTRNYAPFNILNELQNNYLDLDVTNIRVQGELKWKVFRQFELSALAAYKYAGTTREHYILDGSNQAEAYRAAYTTTIRNSNSFLYTDPDVNFALPETVLPYGGIFQRTDNKMKGWDIRLSGNFTENFGHHMINGYGGMEVNSVDRHEIWFRGWGMQYDLGEIANYAYEVFKKGAEDNSDYFTLSNTHERRAAFFGTATYSYKGRYTLNGTVRYEGTNKLGKSRSARWLPTWNVSGAWNAHEEPWFHNTFKSALTTATLKASYSLTAESGPSWVTNSLPVIKSYNPWRPSAGLRESGLEVVRHGLSQFIETADFAQRKQVMEDLSDACIVLPGSFGTMDELFTYACNRAIDKHTKPIFLFNFEGYYDPLRQLLTNMQEAGFMKPFMASALTFCDTIDEIIALLV